MSMQIVNTPTREVPRPDCCNVRGNLCDACKAATVNNNSIVTNSRHDDDPDRPFFVDNALAEEPLGVPQWDFDDNEDTQTPKRQPVTNRGDKPEPLGQPVWNWEE